MNWHKENIVEYLRMVGMFHWYNNYAYFTVNGWALLKDIFLKDDFLGRQTTQKIWRFS